VHFVVLLERFCAETFRLSDELPFRRLGDWTVESPNAFGGGANAMAI
jgi:hypothetical protein